MFRANSSKQISIRVLAYLDGELPLGEVDIPLLLLLRGAGRLVLVESSADGTGGLDAEVERSVLLALVEQAELSALLGVDDGQGPGDGLANIVAVPISSALRSSTSRVSALSRFSLGSRSKLHLRELRRSTGGDLLAAEGGKLLLELIELLEEVLLGLRPQLSCFNAGLQSVASVKFPTPTTFHPVPRIIHFATRSNGVLAAYHGVGCRRAICRWFGGAVVCRESSIGDGPFGENSLLLTAPSVFNVGDCCAAGLNPHCTVSRGLERLISSYLANLEPLTEARKRCKRGTGSWLIKRRLDPELSGLRKQPPKHSPRITQTTSPAIMTTTNAWAQLRQQARALEAQVRRAHRESRQL